MVNIGEFEDEFKQCADSLFEYGLISEEAHRSFIDEDDKQDMMTGWSLMDSVKVKDN